MRIQADRVSLDGAHGQLLPATSVTVDTGELVLLHGDPGVGLTAMGLALAGRMKPTTGTVTVDGEPAPAALRRGVALIDVPAVTEPDEALPVRVVVGEELSLAGKPASKADTLEWLARFDAAPYADQRFEMLEPGSRTRMLAELAASRPGVGVLVFGTPDRHTSDVSAWLPVAEEFAARDYGVVVLTGTVPPAVLPATPALIGEHDQPEPSRPHREPAEDIQEGLDA